MLALILPRRTKLSPSCFDLSLAVTDNIAVPRVVVECLLLQQLGFLFSVCKSFGQYGDILLCKSGFTVTVL